MVRAVSDADADTGIIGRRIGMAVSGGEIKCHENPGTSARFNISSIPNVLLFSRGKLVNQLVGLRPKAAYLEAVHSLGG